MNSQQPSNRNRREVHVVEWLISRLGNTLADRNGDRQPPPWEPRGNVVIGVLEPIRIPAPKPTDSAESTSDDEASVVLPELKMPEDADVPSMSIDFLVELPEGASSLELVLDAQFSLYTEAVALLEDQRKYLGDGGEAVPLPADEAETQQAESAGADEPPADVTPSTDSAEAEASADAESTAEQPEPPKKQARERKARLLGTWQRQRIEVPAFQMSVPLDGSVVEEERALLDAIKPVIDGHYERPDAMRPLTTKRNELPKSALDSDEAFASAIAGLLDRQWAHTYPDLRVSAFVQEVGRNQYLVNVALRNLTLQAGGTKAAQDFGAYDCGFAVQIQHPAALQKQRFELAPRDYRLVDLSEIIGRGTNCVATDRADGGIRTETLPVFAQQIIDPRVEHVRSPRWDELADDPRAILDSIESAMRRYLDDFRAVVSSATSDVQPAVERDCEQFADELRRFQLGRRCLERDPRLATAFKLANRSFALANRDKPFATWRLFQIVYIVSHLPALAAREHDDPEVRAELDYVDVLWFAAGGGKTEAYLGLILTALFYDRLREKHAGVTAWLRFPLRMLSVQQLFRTLRVLVVAEELRIAEEIGARSAEPFALGYLVGGGNTPNTLRFERGWWRGWEIEKSKAAKKTFSEDHVDHRLITRCPYCQKEKVELRLDEKAVRILHVCSACERTLPLHITDEEIYRSLPSVIISTVDKLTGYTWFPEFTSFTHGPTRRCAEHGYFSFTGPKGCCLVGDLCTAPRGGHPKVVPFKDPVPALTIQDEMHLLKEELGAFGAHYEGMIADIQRHSPTRLPSKILTASATIEQYEDQLRQVYGRRPRSFPSPGWQRSLSFYTETKPDIRRMFLGVLPHYRRKADVAAIVQCEFIRAIAELEEASDIHQQLKIPDALWEQPYTPQQGLDLLFDYEVSLGYVNSKAHGSKISEELSNLSDAMQHEGLGSLKREVLTGQVSIPDLADAIKRVEEQTLAVPRDKRLRALVGTSVISHGVDLDRLNALALAGMPTTAADYIQVTARAGRTHVGLVVTVFDAFSRRERSLFSNFLSYHTFLDRMVTPVPVNKYAFFVAERTLPGIVLALLHDLARDPGLNGPEEGVKYIKSFQTWWNSDRAAIDAHLVKRLRDCFATPVPNVNDQAMEDELVRRVLERWTGSERSRLHRSAEEKLTATLFSNDPLPNFRSIDVASEFVVRSAHRNADAFKALLNGVGDDVDENALAAEVTD